jgi:hypothetical protein
MPGGACIADGDADSLLAWHPTSSATIKHEASRLRVDIRRSVSARPSAAQPDAVAKP